MSRGPEDEKEAAMQGTGVECSRRGGWKCRGYKMGERLACSKTGRDSVCLEHIAQGGGQF